MAQRKHQQQHQLEIDMDLRLVEIIQQAQDVEEWNEGMLYAFLRAAYGKGYTDALVEAKNGEPQKLLIEHGYRLFL